MNSRSMIKWLFLWIILEKWQWDLRQVHIIPTQDQQHSIFGARQLLLKNIKKFRSEDDCKRTDQQAQMNKRKNIWLLVSWNHWFGLKSLKRILAHRMAEMEKRRVGTRFLEREVTQSDLEKPFLLYLFETKRCSIMWKSNKIYNMLKYYELKNKKLDQKGK